MTSSSQHYALVPCQNGGSNPLLLNKNENESSSPSSNDPRSELIDLYQSYADMYPNPKLIEETRQRDMLLQASSAAKNAKSTNKVKKKGFFSRLFGGREKEEDTTIHATDSSSASTDPLIYTDTENETDDGSLCGTLQSIDLSCIPSEVYSVARFHLASTRTHREQPNAFLEPIGIDSSSTLIAVGLGEIAEFSASSTPHISETSDRQELLAYAENTEDFALHFVRATVLSPNCIAVSWGFIDGITVVYRRIKFPRLNYEWEAVMLIGPSNPVLDNMTTREFFHDDSDHPGSPLLRVSDCLSLQVETGEKHEPIVLSLALSRLGGYIELVPIPAIIWNGPILIPETHQLPSTKRKRSGQGQNYSGGKPIKSLPNTLALTTFEYHIDIISLRALRTSVKADSPWNNQAYQDSPPSEYILCASGMNQEGYETISFWATSIIFTETQDGEAGIRLQLHSTLIEVITEGTGAEVSVFASPGIMKRWRIPRNIKLQDSATAPDQENEESNSGNNGTNRVTTISATAPIITLRFFQRKDHHRGSFLGILDWNGGITVLDCTVLEKVAAQTLNQQEYNMFQKANEKESFPLVSCLASRSEFADTLKSFNTSKPTHNSSVVEIGNLHWIKPSAGQSVGLKFPPLALLLRESKKLAIISFAESTSLVTVAFPGKGAAMKSCNDGRISLVSKKIGQGGLVLKYFNMQQLQPLEIIQSLARDSKFEEAIQAANKLSDYDQEALSDVIEDCHKEVWRARVDVDSLSETRNVSYIVQEALSLCTSNAKDKKLNMDTLRVICGLAMTMGRKYQPTMSQIESIGDFLVKLGTYELLCQHFSVEASLSNFRSKFQDTPIADLAKQLAERAEIAGLAIVVFRHQWSIGAGILGILEKIPHSVDPKSFMHLLPVIKNDEFSDTFLYSRGVDTESNMHWSSMPQCIADKDGTALVLDSGDEKLVLDTRKSRALDQTKINDILTSVTSWFVERAAKMQMFVGDIQNVVTFCELGLRCTTSTMDHEKLLSSPLLVQRLYKSWRSASSLQKMLMDNIGCPIEDGNSIFTIHTDDLLSMELVELVDLVFQGETDEGAILTKCSNYLEPLISDLSFGTSTEKNAGLDEAIVSYCNDLVQECQNIRENDCEIEEWILALEKATAACAAIASTSKTSLYKEERLIKDRKKLGELVLGVIHDVSLALEQTEISLQPTREIVSSFWTMYETLPAFAPSIEDPSMLESNSSEKVDFLSQDLVGMDILSRWPGCSPFSFFMLRQRCEDGARKRGIVVQLCQSFLDQTDKAPSKETCFLLLQDLLSDLEHLNNICFQGTLQIPKVLADTLVPRFLLDGSFDLLAAYIGTNPTLVDKDKMKEAVLDFLEEAVFSDGEKSSNISLAMKCQDIIGPSFVDILPAFQSIRRYLDASHFINNVIFEGIEEIEPVSATKIRHTLPLDMIECVLEGVPEAVICGCPQWVDRVFARDSNSILRQAADQALNQNGDVPFGGDLPVLPGGAIFHLATILGLDDAISAIVVKCRVVHYARREEMQGAAAAICRTLIRDDHLTTHDNDVAALAKLGAVASVVKDELYPDISTKKELCLAALHKFKGSVQLFKSEAYETIIKVASVLDLQTSRFSREQHNVFAGRQETLLSRPVARVYCHILSEYNADIHQLLSDLLTQVSDGVVHDSLINALSRFVIYWCVSDSKTLKLKVDMNDKNDAKRNLALGCSMILHISSKLTAINCVLELQKIAADQAETVSREERFSSSNDICIPDDKIVQRLIGRGYSSNAACRAAVMTRNQGYNEALEWAVAHTMDHNFDDPILNLRTPNRKLIDQDAIQNLQNSLIAINRYLEDPKSMASFLRFISRMQENNVDPSSKSNSKMLTSNKAAKSNPPSARDKIPAVALDSASNKSFPSTVPPPKHLPMHSKEGAKPVLKSSKVTPSSLELPTQPTSQITYPPEPVVRTETSVSTALSLQKVLTDPHSSTIKVSKISVPLQNNISRGSKSPSKSPPPPPPSTTQSKLKATAQPGKRLVTSKTTTFRLTKNTPDERRKLIEEGRQLFQRSRMQAASGGAKTKASPPTRKAAARARSSPPPAPSTLLKTSVSQRQPIARRLEQKHVISADIDDAASEDSEWNFDDFDKM